MENSKDFYFDYRKFTKAALTNDQINLLLDHIINFKVPKVPIPYVGPYLEMAILTAKIAGIIKLIHMKKENVETELMVEKQIHSQNLRRRHDDDVIN